MKKIESLFNKTIRTLLWVNALLCSLFQYWYKNPHQTNRVVLFLIKKIKFIPMFLQRNTEFERVSDEYQTLLTKTVKLYDQLDFDPYSAASYRKINGKLTNPYQLLYFLVRKLCPKQVIETGVAGGVSSGFILQAIKDNKIGKLYSIDLPFQWYSYGLTELHLDSLPPGKLSGYLIPDELKKNWELIIGDTQKELPKLIKKVGQIDMFFHDSEHTYKTMMFEYQLCWPKLSRKGVLVSDDVDFSEAFYDFAKIQKRNVIVFKQVGIAFRYNK